MKKITKWALAVLFTAGAVSTGYSQADQRNLGAKCGCPAVNTRPVTQIESTFGTTTARGVDEAISNIHLTCDKLWQFSNKLYIPAPYVLTIDPGTVIQGIYTGIADSASVLVIERGAQIIAAGTEDCNIVMTTSNDNLDGTYSVSNVSQWGGLVLFGQAKNNLLDTINKVGAGPYPNGGYPLGFGLDGEGHGEGFYTTPNVGNTFGTNPADPNGFTTPNDHDNSGVLTYVSVRHPGALIGGLAKGNEINGITMSSIGDGTTINHVEVIASGDDDYEYFGGTVNVKYMASYFGDDDKFDYDIGYRGKAQFLFSITADSLNSGDLHSSDNGFEGDADDQFGSTDARFPFSSNPQLWNATFISSGRVHGELDNTGPAGIQCKEMNTGAVRNSIFVNFRSGCHFSEVRSNAAYSGFSQGNGGDGYDNWATGSGHTSPLAHGLPSVNPLTGQHFPDPGSMIVQDNIFVVPNDGLHYGFTRGALIQNGTFYGQAAGKYKKDFTGTSPITIYQTTTSTGQSQYVGIPTAADSAQFLTTDHNKIVMSPSIAGASSVIPGIQTNWAFNGSNNGFTKPFHAIPLNTPANITLLTSTQTPPADGFFTVVNYKGAFDPTNEHNTWLSNYGLSSIMNQTMINSNPTDINQDGVTDINDFLILVGKFGQQDN